MEPSLYWQFRITVDDDNPLERRQVRRWLRRFSEDVEDVDLSTRVTPSRNELVHNVWVQFRNPIVPHSPERLLSWLERTGADVIQLEYEEGEPPEPDIEDPDEFDFNDDFCAPAA